MIESILYIYISLLSTNYEVMIKLCKPLYEITTRSEDA